MRKEKLLLLAALAVVAGLAITSNANAQLNIPWALCAADFNGDNLIDLVAANNGGGANGVISLFLNQGNNTFAQTDYPGGNQGRHCAVADLNGDEVPDIAVANGVGNNVSVLLNNGDGTFGETTNYMHGAGLWSVALGDVNADGSVDIVTGNSGGGGRLGVLLNDGTGAFAPAEGSPFASGTDTRFASLADVNGDGVLDAVASNYNPSMITVMFGNGDGTFTAGKPFASVTGHPNRSIIADLNGDEILDLAYANHLTGNTAFRLGNGDGTFGDAVVSPGGSQTESLVGPADFNGDGLMDIVSGAANGFVVKFGNGDGTFNNMAIQTGGTVRAVGIGDINGDKILDIVVANQMASSTLLVFLGDGAGDFTLFE